MQESPRIAIIGGSGLYHMPGLEIIERLELETPFGKPSAPLVVGRLGGKSVVFLARHGIGHQFSPSQVNYRANIYALKSLGVERIVSITACGSLREDYAPGDIVVPDQLFDFTKDRPRTFFDGQLVAHISVAEPFCQDFSQYLEAALKDAGATIHPTGAFITVEGPRFSTRSESNVFRSWGISIIGMTTSPEAFLAREAEMCYAAMAHVTDFDVWHVSEEPVTAEMVFQTVKHNMTVTQEAVIALMATDFETRTCDCHQALASALSTHKESIGLDARRRLALLVDKYLND